MEDHEKKSQIHFIIPDKLKREWKRKFEERGHTTLTAGIIAAVFNYLYLPTLENPELSEIISELRGFIDTFEMLESKLEEKTHQVHSILSNDVDYSYISDEDYEKTKELLLDKIKRYQPVEITSLELITKIPKEILLPILTRMYDEKLVEMPKGTKWCLKDV